MLLAAASFMVGLAPAEAAQRPHRWLDTEGLYYLDGGHNSVDETSLVITRDGEAIPPKANDPDAPTLPGFYVSGTRYRFTSHRVSMRSVVFRTVSVGGVSYRFTGSVGREDVESIKNVPYVIGTLTTTKHGKTVRQKRRFVHAVIL
jgi:hypothetical protein